MAHVQKSLQKSPIFDDRLRLNGGTDFDIMRPFNSKFYVAQFLWKTISFKMRYFWVLSRKLKNAKIP